MNHKDTKTQRQSGSAVRICFDSGPLCLCVFVSLWFLTASASAHHGNSAYDEQARVPVKGTVTEFVWTNPHAQIYLDVKDKNGKVVN